MPLVQLVPLLVLNCQVAPASRPVTLMRPLLVTPSEEFEPVSVASDTVGVPGAATSFVNASAVLSGPVEFLSVSRAVSDLAPSAPRSVPETVKS